MTAHDPMNQLRELTLERTIIAQIPTVTKHGHSVPTRQPA
jgi:hypothetical protein